MTGTIFRLCVDRGYGFITVKGRAKDVFLHQNELVPELEFGENLRNKEVIFELTTTAKGDRAQNVRLAQP